MSPKSLVLIAAAIALLGMGVYLFIQVRATPAEAQSTVTATAGRPSPAPERSLPAPAPAPTQTRVATAPQANQVRDGVRAGGPAIESPAMAPPPDEARPNVKLDSMMELANKAYDAQDFDQAIAIAGKVLSKDPANVRMLRIMVSANCIGGDAAVAQSYFEKLPKGIDRDQMKQRCDRYQVTLKEP